jgi:hypothetical protein
MTMPKLVKYLAKDPKYTNLGIQLDNGFVLPIRPVVSKHYYQLVELAEQVKIEYKKKGE